MMIGTANGNKVMWNANAGTVTVHKTSVMIVLKTNKYEEAIKASKRNLKNFKAK